MESTRATRVMHVGGCGPNRHTPQLRDTPLAIEHRPEGAPELIPFAQRPFPGRPALGLWPAGGLLCPSVPGRSASPKTASVGALAMSSPDYLDFRARAEFPVPWEEVLPEQPGPAGQRGFPHGASSRRFQRPPCLPECERSHREALSAPGVQSTCAWRHRCPGFCTTTPGGLKAPGGHSESPPRQLQDPVPAGLAGTLRYPASSNVLPHP